MCCYNLNLYMVVVIILIVILLLLFSFVVFFLHFAFTLSLLSVANLESQENSKVQSDFSYVNLFFSILYFNIIC